MANKDISEKLKKARKMCGYTQKKVCELLNVKQSTFSSWERGKSEPEIVTIFRLCDIYSIKDAKEYFMCKNVDEYFKNKQNDSIDSAAMNAAEIKADSKIEESLVKDFVKLDERGKAAVINCINFELSLLEKPIKVDTLSDLKHNYPMRKIPVFVQPAAAGLGNYLDGSDFKIMETNAPNDADVGIRISGDSMQPVINDGTIAWIKRCETINDNEIGIFILNGNAYCKVLKHTDTGLYLSSINKAYSDIAIGEYDSLRVYGKVLIDNSILKNI